MLIASTCSLPVYVYGLYKLIAHTYAYCCKFIACICSLLDYAHCPYVLIVRMCLLPVYAHCKNMLIARIWSLQEYAHCPTMLISSTQLRIFRQEIVNKRRTNGVNTIEYPVDLDRIQSQLVPRTSRFLIDIS